MQLLEIFFIFVLPVLLIYFNIIPIKYRDWILLAFSLLVLGIIIHGHWSLSALGIRLDNFKQSVIPYTIFTLLGILIIVLLGKLLHKTPVYGQGDQPQFLYVFIPISILQEFLFRSFLMPQLESIFSSIILVIVINAILFAFLHIIFPNPLLLLPLGFLAGIGFATIYYFYPNLILISIAHSILTFFAVSYSFFSFPRENKS